MIKMTNMLCVFWSNPGFFPLDSQLSSLFGWRQGSKGWGLRLGEQSATESWPQAGCHNEKGSLPPTPSQKTQGGGEEAEAEDVYCRGICWEINPCIQELLTPQVLICITKEWFIWLWQTWFVSTALKISFKKKKKISFNLGNLAHTSIKPLKSKTSYRRDQKMLFQKGAIYEYYTWIYLFERDNIQYIETPPCLLYVTQLTHSCYPPGPCHYLNESPGFVGSWQVYVRKTMLA